MQTNSYQSMERRRHLLRSGIAAISLLSCCWGGVVAGRAGISRLLSEYGRIFSLPAALNEAVYLGPADPQAHYSRAVVLAQMGDLAEAAREFEHAAMLRPHDYFLWYRLGRLRDQMGEDEGALAAFRESVRLAPFYARPRWQLGNLLLRMGRNDEAFRELRRAASSDAALLPKAIDLLWGASEGGAQTVAQLIRPESPAERLALARFFATHEQTQEAVEMFRTAGHVSEADRRALLTDLLAAKRFKEAYEVWASGQEMGADQSNGAAGITDGSFENLKSLYDPGFGWQLGRDVQAVRLFIDMTDPHDGARSLLVDWIGNSNPSSPVLSQLVLVEPGARYRLSFAARTREVVTGGLPVITVTDACSKDRHLLTQSQPLPQGTNGWHDYSVEFTTPPATSAVLISLQRQNCSTGPCPIFGRVWLDAFFLEPLTKMPMRVDSRHGTAAG